MNHFTPAETDFAAAEPGRRVPVEPEPGARAPYAPPRLEVHGQAQAITAGSDGGQAPDGDAGSFASPA